MQNTQETAFTIIFVTLPVSKSIMLALVLVIGFLVGFIVRKKTVAETRNKASYQNIPLEIENTLTDDQEYISMTNKKGLSNEDRDYIN